MSTCRPAHHLRNLEVRQDSLDASGIEKDLYYVNMRVGSGCSGVDQTSSRQPSRVTVRLLSTAVFLKLAASLQVTLSYFAPCRLAEYVAHFPDSAQSYRPICPIQRSHKYRFTSPHLDVSSAPAQACRPASHLFSRFCSTHEPINILPVIAAWKLLLFHNCSHPVAQFHLQRIPFFSTSLHYDGAFIRH